ncbi:MAG: energy transducer TonB [Mangrovibacterium sp.]
MKKLTTLYKDHIYGVMGTLIFHILLVSSFLLADVNLKGELKEEPVIIDFSDVEDDLPEIPQEEQEDDNTPTREDQLSTTTRSNRAVNDAAAKDPFFDETYRQEIEAAQKLVSDVNNQLSKEIPEIKQFEMPEETTEGVHPDSIRNTIYSGESNIHYSLENRYHLRLPVPVYLAQGGGTITVDIWVATSGKVVKAEVRPAGKIKDPMLPEYARQAALRTIFNTDQAAPSPQTGTITYTFVAQ